MGQLLHQPGPESGGESGGWGSDAGHIDHNYRGAVHLDHDNSASDYDHHNYRASDYDHDNRTSDYDHDNRTSDYDHDNRTSDYDHDNRTSDYDHDNSTSDYDHDNSTSDHDHDNSTSDYDHHNSASDYHHHNYRSSDYDHHNSASDYHHHHYRASDYDHYNSASDYHHYNYRASDYHHNYRASDYHHHNYRASDYHHHYRASDYDHHNYRASDYHHHYRASDYHHHYRASDYDHHTTADHNTHPMKSTCILVGNGTSILNSARGAEIDAYDNVVRFNRFTLGEFAPYTGMRCDTWFTVRPVSLSQIQSQQPWRKVWCHSWEPKAEKCEVFQSHFTHRSDRALEKIDHKVLIEISDYFKAGFTYWSTGLLAIWTMLQEHTYVTITGFDWWEKTQHHYNDQEIRGTLHKPELEHDCIKRLAAEDRLHFL